MRVSSGPVFLLNASSTASSAAVHCGVKLTLDPARVMQGPVQPQPPIREPTIIGVGLRAAAPHLLRQPGQIRQLRAARRSRQQNRIRARLLTFGELAVQEQISRAHDAEISPAASALPHRRMRGQPSRPPDRPRPPRCS